MFLLVGIYSFVIDLLQVNGYEWVDTKVVTYSWITKMSLGNFGMD